VFKRLTWMTVGAAAGAVGTVWTQRKLKAQAQRLTPPALVEQAKAKATGVRHQLTAAVAEGRDAMKSTEVDMRQRLDERTNGRTPNGGGPPHR